MVSRDPNASVVAKVGDFGAQTHAFCPVSFGGHAYM